MRGFCMCIMLSASFLSSEVLAKESTNNRPRVEKVLDELVVDGLISSFLAAQTVDELSDCAFTYKMLAESDLDDTDYSPRNLLRKSNYFDRAIYIKSYRDSKYKPFDEKTTYLRLLLETEKSAYAGELEKIQDLMNLVFAKDGECSFLLQKTINDVTDAAGTEGKE